MRKINTSTYQRQIELYRERVSENYSRIQTLFEGQNNQLNQLREEIEKTSSSLKNFKAPSIDDQIDQIESLNQSQLINNISSVFENNDSQGFSPFVLMPLDFNINKTKSNATMLFVVHEALILQNLDPEHLTR